ncbi:MAG: hypothetical protein Q8J76_07860, partial [Desulfobulbaceae bacterium]|nr:hypothetical protein [Desulfobulbaceae bacterium]
MDQTSLNNNDYDTPWKDAVTRYFPEFMAFYFPEAHSQIDWEQPYTFLDQELAQVVQDAELGKRLIDRLVQVAILAGGEGWVYIHVEVQGGHDSQFAERMFTYNYRLYDRYRRPVASMAVLADDSTRWRPDSFGYQLFGCRHLLEFPIVKLCDHADRLESLLTQANSFALVTAAHLLTQQTKGDNDRRFAAKWRLTKLLYERNWDKQHIIDLFGVIDWMMRLPPELEKQLWQDITILERSKTMPYVTSIERIGIEKGIQQGIQQGMQQGMQQGESQLLGRLLVRRFGPLPQWVENHLTEATISQLEA